MLDILRKQASSWLTKTFLGLIALVFIFYFGWSALRQGGTPTSIVASVNGDAISRQELDFFFQNRLEDYEKIYKNKLPDVLLAQLRQMTLQSLVAQRLIAQETTKMGLQISDSELRDLIEKDPTLQIKGKFDPYHYRDVFLPWFTNKTGLDYEELVRGDQLQAKLRSLIEKSLFLSEAFLKNQYQVENTKITPEGVVTEEPDWEEFEKTGKDQLRKRLTNELVNRYFESWFDEIFQKAKIKIHEPS